MPPFGTPLPVDRIFFQRLIIGIGQGAVLFALYLLHDLKLWANPYTFLPVVLTALFLPLVAIGGLGHVAVRPLAAWIAGVGAVIVIVSLSAAYRLGSLNVDDGEFGLLIATLVVGLFIAHTLFVARRVDGTWAASYQTCFELAWKHALQIIAGALFVAAFWALYFLGAALFKLLKIGLLERLIMDGRFIPVTAVVAAVALHMTDVRTGIISGLRGLALTLLSWLLPLLTLFVAVFLILLPFAGFDLLWDTRSATALLLAASAALIVLINAVYQNGAADHTPPAVLKLAASVAAVILTPLVLIAGYGLALRVGQYGWTADRIVAAACVVVAAGYAFGYARAVVARGAWLRGIERANIVMSYAAVAVLIALFTPIADPARVSVASQIGRLKDGRIALAQLDLTYLRFDAGRYGIKALEDLKADGNVTADVRARIESLMKAEARFSAENITVAQGMLKDYVDLIPQSLPLPQSFLDQDWLATADNARRLPGCFKAQGRCNALVADMNADGTPEVLLIGGTGADNAVVFQSASEGWRVAGNIFGSAGCMAQVIAGQGSIAVVAPRWHELDVAGRRLQIAPADNGSCEAPRN